MSKCRNVLCCQNDKNHLTGCAYWIDSWVKACEHRKAFNRIDFELKKDNFMQDYWRAQLAKLRGE